MYPRVEYQMTDEDLDKILDACKPVSYIVVGGLVPESPQTRANRAWAALGAKMGFDYMSVRPVEGKGQKVFTAIPSETNDQRKERLYREERESRARRIGELDAQIAKLEQERAALREEK